MREEARRTLRYGEPLSETRTRLADFFSILLELRCRGGHVIRPNGFYPFSGDGIAFLHRHAGIGVEHLNATSAAPREKVEEMVFADGTCAGRGIGCLRAIRRAAMTTQHLGPPVNFLSMPVGCADFQARDALRRLTLSAS